MARLEEDIYLVAALRTPIGKFGGALSALTAAQLGTESAKATLSRSIRRSSTCTAARSRLDIRSAAPAARITTTLLHALRTREKTVGLATLCISGGMGLSMVVERV